ncbi:hypothetical protein BIY24_06035 [Halobacteriovorax marinus]|uniref:hypothetical protein n=1 Tax=Halobacteriovorax marinus TaxID=97084 RepID=UPI000BC34A63|nr:hypothetical protein [Halobacteriovorax marinus]ATH07516.1 hypothetical protein BIY24_06035 [Halobacteriovorax marinus]
MTKKKNGIFSKIKSKFSKQDEDEFEEDIYEEVDEEEYIDDDFEESTGDIAVDPEALEMQALKDEEDQDLEESDLPPQIDEASSEQVSFSEEQEDDDIEDMLNSRPAVEEEEDSEDDEEDEEVFVAQEFKISDEEKEELEDLDAPLQEFNPARDQEDEELEHFDDDYEDEFYEDPKPSVSQRFMAFLANVKDKVPSRESFSLRRSHNSDEEEFESVASSTPALMKVQEKFNLSNLTWNGFVEKTFSPDSRQDIHRTFLTCMILGCSYFGGKIIATGISSKLETQTKKPRAATGIYTPRARVAVLKIEKSNLFNTKDPSLDGVKPIEKPKVDENLVCKSADRKSQLGIKLVNTIVLQDSVKSIASVQVRGKNQILDIREGEKINNDAEIGKIDRLRVVFKNLKTGDCEYVESQSKEPRVKNPINVVSASKGKNLLNKYKDSRIQNVGNTFKIQKKVRDEMLGNISEVLTQARAIQIKNPDGTLAFKMTEIVPGSIYSKLNIQEGDTITAINGKKFSNLNEIMNLFGKIKDIDRFELSVRRDGSTQNLEYNFE